MAGDRDGAIHFEIADGVALVTIDNPDVRNALSETMAQTLLEICDDIDADESIGALVLTGAGRTFCSGADTRVLLSADAARSGPSPTRRSIYESFLRVGSLSVPTIAAVRGAAVGAGLNLAMATDLRVVSSDARLIAGFQRIGIHPGGGFFSLASALAGRETATAMGLFGEELSGEAAVRLGFAWQAVDSDLVLERARELALRVAKDPQLARVAVRSLRLEVGPPPMSWPAAVELERGPQLWSRQRLELRADG